MSRGRSRVVKKEIDRDRGKVTVPIGGGRILVKKIGDRDRRRVSRS